MSKSQHFIFANDFKMEDVVFKEPKKNAAGGQSILLNYTHPVTKKSGPLIIQTPKMKTPFGVAADKPDGATITKYSINGSLAGKDNNNENLKAFTNIIHNLDKYAQEMAVQNSEEWFGKKYKADVISEFYKSAEKVPKDPKYPSTLKMKLPTRIVNDKTVPQFDIYNESKEIVNIVVNDNELDLSCLQKGGEIVALLQCSGIWFVGKNQFGLGWRVLQIKTFTTQKLVGYSIIDDDPDEEEEEEEEVEEEDDEEVG